MAARSRREEFLRKHHAPREGEKEKERKIIRIPEPIPSPLPELGKGGEKKREGQAPPEPEPPPIRIPGHKVPVPRPMPRVPGLVEPPAELLPPGWELGEPFPIEKTPLKQPPDEERKAPVSLKPRMEQMPRVVPPREAPKPIRIPEGPPLRIPKPITPPTEPPELPAPREGEEEKERRGAPPSAQPAA